MRILRHILAATVLAFCAETMWAQSITESVTVEGKYTPEIIPADRLALLPATVTLKAPESPMAYDRKGLAANFAPDALNMPATGWKATKAYNTSKGYVDMWLGSWLNSSLSAGYSVIDLPDTRLNVYLQHNSTSLWQAWEKDPDEGLAAADKRFRYDECIGADFQNNLTGKGTVSAGVQYHIGYFNYYTAITNGIEDGHYKAPTQTLNDLSARVSWSAKPTERLSYDVKADVRYFGFREGERETTLDAGGDIAYTVNDKSRLDAELLYTGVLNNIGNDVNRLKLTPGYELTIGPSSLLRIGIDLALTTGSKTRFRAAPDVRFSTRKGIIALSAKAGGGTNLRTLAWMHASDYYSNPFAGCFQAAYTPLDIDLALQLNPGGKWTAGAEWEWRTTKDETLAALYASPVHISNIHGFSLSVNAGYEFCRQFSLKGLASWQPQKENTGFMNGFDRPELTASLSAESRPTDKLSLKLDFALRARRQLGLKSFSSLNLTGDYQITDKISVGAAICNLLNRKQEILPGLPVEGINATAGVQIVF